jgi:hypothetical protein
MIRLDKVLTAMTNGQQTPVISSFRDLLQVSGFIGIAVSFTINHHLIGKILLQVMLNTN